MRAFAIIGLVLVHGFTYAILGILNGIIWFVNKCERGLR